MRDEPRDQGSESERDFRVTMMYDPSHHVTDLDAAERFFEDVFGRPSTPLASMMRQAPPRDGYPTDYSTFTPLNGVLCESRSIRASPRTGRCPRWRMMTRRGSKVLTPHGP